MIYYTLSRASRKLAVAIGRRRQRISTTHNLSPRQHYNLTPISYTCYNSNRIIPSLNQSIHCFSSLPTIEDDDKDSSDVGSDDDLDGLKSEIERLKCLDDDVSSIAEDVDTNTADSEGSKLSLLNAMKSSPFGEPPPSSSQPSSNINTTTEEDTKPNLSELLSNNDIFTQSWAEPDREEYSYSSNTRRSNDYYNSSSRYDRGSSYGRGSEYNNTNNRPRDYRDRDRQRSD